MEIQSCDFLEAKFGQAREAVFIIYPRKDGEEIISGDLANLLSEFKNLLSAKDVREAKNPRSGKYTVIDKDRGWIIGAFDNPVT